MGLYEERTTHKDSSGVLQCTPDLRNIYFHVDKFVLFFHTLTVKCYEFSTTKHSLYHNFKWILYIDLVFRGWQFFYKILGTVIYINSDISKQLPTVNSSKLTFHSSQDTEYYSFLDLN